MSRTCIIGTSTDHEDGLTVSALCSEQDRVRRVEERDVAPPLLAGRYNPEKLGV
jgi:hypothetical protein